MTLRDEFEQAMENTYQQAGRQAGYWAQYFIRDIRTKGALATAKQLLRPRKNDSIHTGLQALIDAGMTHISVERIVLRDEFRALFTPEELAEAERRLALLPEHLTREPVPPAENH